MPSTPSIVREPELRERLRQLDELDTEFDVIFDGCDDAALNRPREDGGWSIAQHVDHLVTTWREYRFPLAAAIDAAAPGTGPFRHAWHCRRLRDRTDGAR